MIGNQEMVLDVREGICHTCYSRKGEVVPAKGGICRSCYQIGEREKKEIVCARCGKTDYRVYSKFCKECSKNIHLKQCRDAQTRFRNAKKSGVKLAK